MIYFCVNACSGSKFIVDIFGWSRSGRGMPHSLKSGGGGGGSWDRLHPLLIKCGHASSHPCHFSWCSCLSFPNSARCICSVYLWSLPLSFLAVPCTLLIDGSCSSQHYIAIDNMQSIHYLQHRWLPGCISCVHRLLLCVYSWAPTS